MADASKAIEAITASRPPATDRFTYLTIIGEYVSPEILPTLNEILQDADLTQEIGWDLVQILLPIPGSEACLETIARLGNPREVILSILGILGTLQPSGNLADLGKGDDVEAAPGRSNDDAHAPDQFVTLLGILAILHKRLKVKKPSRFLASTLQAILLAYRPTEPQMTGAVINLVHSLSGRRRPTLPTRKSSLSVSGLLDPDRDGDASKNAPDPEASDSDAIAAGDEAIQKRLLLSFVSCILESYVNSNSLAWSTRLLEYYSPEKIVPRRQTALQAYRDDEDLQSRDAIVGQLAALTKDLGLTPDSKDFLEAVIHGPYQRDPLAETDDGVAKSEQIALSSGGSISLLAYWVFSNDVFDAGQVAPDLYAFPDHFAILQKFLEDDAQGQVMSSPGVMDALVTLGLWLVHKERVVTRQSDQEEEVEADYMNYHMLLTLIAVYHPSIQIRNAATALAGLILHADPEVNDRLKILYDLLENCMFATLKACAVSWLREELISAAPESSSHKDTANPFSGPEAVDNVQYAVFPNLDTLAEMDEDALLEWWAQNSPFILQVINFTLFLFHDNGVYAHAVPNGMATAVEMRFIEPLSAVVKVLQTAAKKENSTGSNLALEADVLQDRLQQLGATAQFRGFAAVDRNGGNVS